jgi:hypothetical protein
MRGQLGDPLLASDRATDDVTPGAIGQGGEDPVNVGGRMHDYNHMVV